eukprot:3760716-Rhodomonas_salina.1
MSSEMHLDGGDVAHVLFEAPQRLLNAQVGRPEHAQNVLRDLLSPGSAANRVSSEPRGSSTTKPHTKAPTICA